MKSHQLFFCFFLLATSLIFSQNKQDCLIAAYNFNQQNVNDNIGTCHGKAVGATLVTDRFGNPNSAWFLYGHPQSYLSLGTYSTLKPVTASISMWFRMDSINMAGSGYAYTPLLHTKCQQGNNCYESYAMYYAFGTKKTFGFSTQLACTQPVAYATSTVTPKKWHMVMITYNSNVMRIYFDGVLENTVIKNFQTTFLSSDSVMVGHSANTMNNRQFYGAVDDIRYYGCMLNDEEVMDVFTETNSIPTGINRQEQGNLMRLYANRQEGRLQVFLPDDGKYEVELLNTLGQVLGVKQNVTKQAVFDLPGCGENFYILRATDEVGRVTLKKCVF